MAPQPLWAVPPCLALLLSPPPHPKNSPHSRLPHGRSTHLHLSWVSSFSSAWEPTVHVRSIHKLHNLVQNTAANASRFTVFLRSDAVATFFLLFVLVGLLIEGGVYFIWKPGIAGTCSSTTQPLSPGVSRGNESYNMYSPRNCQ